MNRLPRFALQRKSLVLAALVLALFWSLASALGMQRREDPGTTQRQTTVVTMWPGATTRDVEQLVTKKIADDLRGVAHVDHVEGTSRPGISQVDVIFDDVIDNADATLRDVRNHVADLRASLPGAIDGPALIDDVWKTYPIIIGISAEGRTPRELRDFAKSLGERLSRLPDVGLVKMVGAQERQVNVDLDLAALSQFGITASDVVNALAAQNALVPAGSAAVGGRLTQIDPAAPLANVADVSAAPVRSIEGRPIRVGDLARVATGYPDPPQEIVHVDGHVGIALAIAAKETSSVTDLGPEVQRFLAKERAEWPAGTQAALIADQPKTVNDRISDFMLNLLLAIAIVTGLVALFMGWRNGLLVGITVVLSIALTFGYMKFVAVDINQISILALIISLGIIVDAGIVAIDNIEHHLRVGLSREEAAARGVGDLWLPLLTSTLVAMSSFLPFRLMGGSIGDFVRDLGVVTSIALAMSLLVAYFVTPLLGAWFAVPSTQGGKVTPFDRLLAAMQRAYVPLATAALHRPVVTVAIAAFAVVAAVIYLPHLGVQFFPSADRAQFFINVAAAEGTDIRTTEKIVERVEKLISRQTGVTAYGAFVGAGSPRFYYNVLSEEPTPSYAQIIVDTTDVAAANRIVADLRERVRAGVGGARIDVKKLEQGPPVGAPIQIRLSGEDPVALGRASLRVQQELAKISGAISIRDSQGQPTTKLTARIEPTRLAAANVQSASVQALVALAYGGTTATQIREPDRQSAVVVRLPAALRADASAFETLAVRNTDGATVPLEEFATIAPATQSSITTLRDGARTITVVADVESGMLASNVLAEFRKHANTLDLPAGVALAYAGEDEQTAKSFRNLLVAVIVGLLINQMVLLWEFRTLRLSLVVLCAVPLGLVGAIFGLAVTGQHFGFVASLGISSLGGIVTNHAIVLFEYAQREMEAGASMEAALILAGTKRMRPIMLTVIASIAGLLPLAFSSQTLWRPFCWAVIFGLGISMLMTLVAIPAIFGLVSRLSIGRKRLPNGAAKAAA
ncbi:MAG: efflux RND transporter permease subunit [Candidatus Velthaea sp.]